jgi:DNA repair protein RadC
MENTNENRLYQVAEIQLTYKSNVKPSLRPKVTTPKDSYNVLIENWDGSKIEFVEQFKVMLLNRAQKGSGHLRSFIRKCYRNGG